MNTTGWRKKQIMTKQQDQMEKLDPLDVVKIVVEALDDAYAAGVRNSSKRTWVGLTPQERDEINEQVYGSVPHHVAFHAAIEAKLKEKNFL